MSWAYPGLLPVGVYDARLPSATVTSPRRVVRPSWTHSLAGVSSYSYWFGVPPATHMEPIFKRWFLNWGAGISSARLNQGGIRE